MSALIARGAWSARTVHSLSPSVGVAVLALLLTAHAGERLSAQIEVAGELFVDLDAADPSAGETTWENAGTLGDFQRVGEPFAVSIEGVPAVSFNEGLTNDAYRSVDVAPDGLVGPDPTRTIEVWAYNVVIADEETLVAWGRRGGPDGSNMSFNYGMNPLFGAVGHWNLNFQDLGWREVPPANRWNHLVYTYDGTTTRVYANGAEANSEELGPGAINTHAGLPITLAAQTMPDGITLDFNGIQGSLSLGRVRVHDEVLSAEQVRSNFEIEAPEFNVLEEGPVFGGIPADDQALAGATYQRTFTVSAFPFASVAVDEPAGAILVEETPRRFTLVYDVPLPGPDFFDVVLNASNAVGDDDAVWRVTVRRLPPEGEVAVAGELFVDLDAADPSAGTEVWANNGTLDDFELVAGGAPAVVTIDGAAAVSFNEAGRTGDAYQCFDLAPPGLVGIDPTRTIEVWAYNPQVAVEETLVAWGRRGGGPGTNMSFNYGTSPLFGAVGHWDTPDIGWGAVPLANQWHHLVYTYDGTTTRVYADGVETASEVLGAGVINTHVDTRITLAAQLLADGVGLDFGGIHGTLALGRVRVHDGVLSPEEVLHNFELETVDFTVPDRGPSFLGVPPDDFTFPGSPYLRRFRADGFPEPTVALIAPAGALLVQDAPLAYTVTYDLVAPSPASFDLVIEASNRAGTVQAMWTVDVRDPPSPGGPIETAGELFVSLDARHESAGADVWENQGTLGDFIRIGVPEVVDHDGASGVSFNSLAPGDAYESVDEAPPGLVGLEPTRSIEVWAYNPSIAAEETLLAWGRRGGPDGSNMSFNYGTNPQFGAVGHWGAAGPDLGWGATPIAERWHHLVYTFDGAVTRVYADGVEAASETLGRGVVDTHAMTRIALATQYLPDGITFDFDVRSGALSIGRVRIHDEVLRPEQVLHNYNEERSEFPQPEPPEPAPLDDPPRHRYSFAGNADDSIGVAHGVAIGDVTFTDGQAVLGNDGTQVSAATLPPEPPVGGYIDLPNGIVSALGNQATFEVWLTWNGPQGSSWQRIFDFGTSGSGEDFSTEAANNYYLFLTPRSGADTLRAGYRNQDILTGLERVVDGPRLADGSEQHVVLVWDGESTTATLYLNGTRLARDTAVHIQLSQILDDNNWLGRSQWGGDPLLSGSYQEFRIYDYALTENQVMGNFIAGPDVLNGIDVDVPGFVRGDVDSDGRIVITDGISLLQSLFVDPTRVVACRDAADTDDNGRLELTDAVVIFQWLFVDPTRPPRPPTPSAGSYVAEDCGVDPTDQDTLDCAQSAGLCL